MERGLENSSFCFLVLAFLGVFWFFDTELDYIEVLKELLFVPVLWSRKPLLSLPYLAGGKIGKEEDGVLDM